MTALGKSILKGARQAVAYAEGDSSQVQTRRVQLAEHIDVAAIRGRLGLSQAGFAAQMGVSPATVRDWEQHRRKPSATARALLTVIAREPKAVARALRIPLEADPPSSGRSGPA